MKRKTATPAEPVTLTAQRLILTAPDGTSRLELSVDHLGGPHLKMLDHNGIERIELGLYYGEEEVPMAERGCSAFINVRDPDGGDCLLVDMTGDSIHGSARINSVRVWECNIDPVEMLSRQKTGARNGQDSRARA